MASSRRPGTNEDVKTFGDTGFGRDYTSLVTWEDATTIDCVTGTTSPVLECYRDATSYALPTSYWEINGANTSSSYFRIIRAASGARHGGSPGTGIKFIGSTGDHVPFLMVEPYASIYDIEVLLETNTTGEFMAIKLFGANTRAVACLVKITDVGTGYDVSGIKLGETSCVAVNCIAYECEHHGFTGKGIVYNCTSVGNGGAGFYPSTASMLGKNNIATGNSSYDYAATNWDTNSTHNLASDATAPEYGTYYDSKTVAYVDAGNDDYRITNDADVVEQGTSLAADGTFAFDDDIAFTTRPSGSAWDLGAFEYVAAEGPTLAQFWSRW